MHRLMIALAIVIFGSTASAQDAYLLQPGDRLEISVLEDPGLNRAVLIRPDGRISLPLAGTLTAAGRTPEALQAAIRSALARDFVEPPTVTVSLTAIGDPPPDDAAGAATIYVLGEVARPGVYDVALPLDVLQALAIAGGPGPFAARRRIQVRRRAGDAVETVFLFDYEGVQSGMAPSAMISMTDGDVIVVPERRLFER